MKSTTAQSPTRSGRVKASPSLSEHQGHTRTSGFGHLGGPVDTDFTVRNPRTGRVLRHLHTSSETEEEKKNKKRNQKYARLCSFDPWRIFTLSENVETGKLSLAIRPCKYPLYETVDAELLMRLYAAIKICGLPFPSSDVLNYKLSNKLDSVTSPPEVTRLELGMKYHEQEFRAKIKAQKKAYKLSQKAHRRRR